MCRDSSDSKDGTPGERAKGSCEVNGELLHETIHENEMLAETVARAVASAADADPKEMKPLYESVDPEALENLFDDERGRWPGCVSFLHAGYRVVIEGQWVGIHGIE